jgi:Domain of unknown function (DUF4402)
MKNLKKIRLFFFIVVLSLISPDVFSQGVPTDSLPGDPGNISVYTVQNIHFGAFTQGAIGGSVILSSGGTRTATGDVVLLNMGVTYYPAIIEVDAIVGTVISIVNGPNATLTGSNGGSMSMSIGSSSPGSPFVNVIQPPGRTPVYIGGTLIVGSPASNPPGTYSGTFYITFNQE